VGPLSHEIVYEHVGGHDAFKTLRLVWEPISDYVSLYFRTPKDAATGMVRPLSQMIEYFDRRAIGGPPWDGPVARAARRRLAELMGKQAPAEPHVYQDAQTELRRTG